MIVILLNTIFFIFSILFDYIDISISVSRVEAYYFVLRYLVIINCKMNMEVITEYYKIVTFNYNNLFCAQSTKVIYHCININLKINYGKEPKV